MIWNDIGSLTYPFSLSKDCGQITLQRYTDRPGSRNQEEYKNTQYAPYHRVILCVRGRVPMARSSLRRATASTLRASRPQLPSVTTPSKDHLGAVEVGAEIAGGLSAAA